MRFSVLWVPFAEQRLAAVWLAAPDRDADTAAAHRIDTLLQMYGDDLGESRAAERRIYLETPLGVLFRVFPERRLVYVLTVWRFDTHK